MDLYIVILNISKKKGPGYISEEMARNQALRPHSPTTEPESVCFL